MKIKNLILILFSALLVNALFGQNTAFGQVIIDTSIDKTDFDAAYSNDMIWYVQFRSGAVSGSNSNEFEIGKSNGSYFLGDTTWFNNMDNMFSVSVSETNFLSAIAGSVTTPSGDQPGITEPFNQIWVGISLSTNDNEDTVNITHSYENSELPNVTLSNSNNTLVWSGFNFYDTQKTTNIADFDIVGNIGIDFFGGSNSVGVFDDWTYTVFATYNSDIGAIPEPASVALISGIFCFFLIYLKRKRS